MESMTIGAIVPASGGGGPPATRSEAEGGDFIATLESALKAVSRSQHESSDLQRRFQLEDPSVSLEDTMVAMSKASIEFQAAVQVRNRLVQAYESIMNMPV